jgi:beta-lactam-binding protein with PASTA domain
VNDEPAGFRDEVLIPDVVGMVVDDARKLAQTVGITLAQPDADGPPLSALTWRLPVVVTSQDPPAGALIRRNHSVVVTWSSELSGVREPRRPAPRSMKDLAAQDPSDASDS